MDALLELLKLAMVGLIAGLFSSMLASHDHRQKRWWELRVAAYQSAIEALSDLINYHETHWQAEVQNRDLSEEFESKLRATWEISFQKVRRLADSGAFLFSTKANAAFAELMRKERYDSYFEHVDAELAKSRKCLNCLVACSESDLKLASSFWERLGW